MRHAPRPRAVPAGMDPATVRALQERAARALPARHVEIADGWWLRASPGCAWWAQTVLPHDQTGDLMQRVEASEEFYARRGVVPGFQLTPGTCDPRLDHLLARRGYRREGPMSLQVARTDDVASSSPLPVAVERQPTRDWFDTWRTVNSADDPHAEWDLLERVDRPSAYARAVLGGEVAGVGRSVADDGWAGIFGMATLPPARGKGAARSVLTSLAAWAASMGAEHLYLQVETDNTAALQLYQEAGFREASHYHYRRAPAGI